MSGRATRNVPARVQDVLVRCGVEGNVAKLPDALERNLYLEVNKVLEGLGGKWDKKQKGHVFPSDPRQVIEDAVLAGSFTDLDRLHQFFETPDDVARQLVAAAGIYGSATTLRVLEPSAGRGAILRALPDDVLVTAFEIDPRHAFTWGAQIARFLPGSTGDGQRDFLLVQPGACPPINAVVMNPPFADGRDVLHVEHALRFLRRGGSLAAVMAAGVVFRMDERTRGFRERFLAMGGAFEALPDGAFRESGTSVRTVIASVRVPG